MKSTNGSRYSRAIAIAMLHLFFIETIHKKMSSTTTDQYVGDMPHIAHRLDDITKPKPVTTLVHFEPYFLGGFRNQHMRFIAFVHFAVKLNITQILLPSLQWMDSYNRPHSIHHELLFDVEYWNSRAGDLGLPTLVHYDPDVLEGVVSNPGNSESAKVIPCWNETSSLYSGLDEPFVRGANMRRTNVWEMIGQVEPYSHCRRHPEGENDPKTIQEAAQGDGNSTNTTYRYTHLIPHAGGGRLWGDYNNLQRPRQNAIDVVTRDNQIVQSYPEHADFEVSIYQLIRPSRYLRLAAENAINQVMQNRTDKTPRLLALHPRVEQEMLTHRCGKLMEPNLTKVFKRIQTFPPLSERNIGDYRFDLIFIAVSKYQIEKQAIGGPLGVIMDQNRDALRSARVHGLFGGNTSSGVGIPIFESGTDTASSVQFPRIPPNGNTSLVTADDLGVLEMVASVINFFIAIQADIFVGVKGSSYSTDAFSVRYYQRKEEGVAENYVVGRDGIDKLYGPAAGHSCNA